MFDSIASNTAGQFALSRFFTTNTWNAQQIFKASAIDTPGAIFQSSGTISANPIGFGGSNVTAQFIAAESSAFPYTVFESAGNAQGHILAFRASRGTYASRTALQSGDKLGELDFGGWGTSLVNGKASIQITTREAWTGTANGTQMVFNVTPVGSTTAATILTLLTGQATVSGSLQAQSTSTTVAGIQARSNGSVTSTPAGYANTSFQAIGGEGVANHSFFEACAGQNQINIRRRNGTYGAVTALASGNIIGDIAFQGWGTSFATNAMIRSTALEAFTGSATGANLEFFTTTAGSTTLTSRLSLGVTAVFSTPVITTSEFQIQGAAGTSRVLFFRTGGSTRWTIEANSVAEGTSNAGSNFSITRYSDAQANLGVALGINRATGVTTLGADRLILTTAYTPPNSSDNGVAGQITWDANYIYVWNAASGANCVKRIALTTF